MESKYKLRIRSLEGVLLVIAVLLMASCSNNDIVKENVIDQKLCLRGYPQEYLDSFPNTMKEELYDRSYLTFENGCVVSANPYAQISTVDISKDEVCK